MTVLSKELKNAPPRVRGGTCARCRCTSPHFESVLAKKTEETPSKSIVIGNLFDINQTSIWQRSDKYDLSYFIIPAKIPNFDSIALDRAPSRNCRRFIENRR